MSETFQQPHTPFIGDQLAKRVTDLIFSRDFDTSILPPDWMSALEPHLEVPYVRSALARVAGIQRAPMKVEDCKDGVFYDSTTFYDIVTSGSLSEKSADQLKFIKTLTPDDSHRWSAADLILSHSTSLSAFTEKL